MRFNEWNLPLTFASVLRFFPGGVCVADPWRRPPAPIVVRRGFRRACRPRGRRRGVRIAAASRAKFIALFRADGAREISLNLRGRAGGERSADRSSSRGVPGSPKPPPRARPRSGRPPSSPRPFRAEFVPRVPRLFRFRRVDDRSAVCHGETVAADPGSGIRIPAGAPRRSDKRGTRPTDEDRRDDGSVWGDGRRRDDGATIGEWNLFNVL